MPCRSHMLYMIYIINSSSLSTIQLIPCGYVNTGILNETKPASIEMFHYRVKVKTHNNFNLFILALLSKGTSGSSGSITELKLKSPT